MLFFPSKFLPRDDPARFRLLGRVSRCTPPPLLLPGSPASQPARPPSRATAMGGGPSPEVTALGPRRDFPPARTSPAGGRSTSLYEDGGSWPRDAAASGSERESQTRT